MSDLIERLRAACQGHPHAKVAWPHRILHEAADRIAALEAGERDRHATNARLARLMGALRRIKWNRHRRPELSEGGTRAAFEDIFDVMFADALDAALIPEAQSRRDR